MKTIDEQIEYMKNEIVEKVEFFEITKEGTVGYEELDLCQSILVTLENVKAGQNETPGSR